MALLPLGELTAAEEAAVRHHAATCERCQKRLAEYDEVYASLRRALVGARSSQPRFTIDDIVLSADLSDSDDDAVGAAGGGTLSSARRSQLEYQGTCGCWHIDGV